jgi:tRNA 2-thiouridine synthesizing protein A
VTSVQDDITDDDADSLPLRELQRIAGGSCLDCRVPYSAREAVWSIALGFKNAPRCLGCLCRRLERTEADLRTSLTEYVQRRECYLRAWREAEILDENNTRPLPTQQRINTSEADVEEPVDSPLFWDAGDLGCGDLVMQLRLRLKNLPAGSVLTLIATDPAAPEDIPAWCRMTGQTLLKADHPSYTIRRKED